MAKLSTTAGFLIMIILLGSFGQRYGDAGLARSSTGFARCSAGLLSRYPVLSDTASPSFLLLSDIHLHGEDDQTPEVTRNSDSGKDLWDSAQKKIRSVLSGEATAMQDGYRSGIAKPKFIIYLGDLPWHGKDSLPAQIADAMDNAGKVLKDLRLMAEDAHIPLLYVPGNNDSEDGDYAPFSEKLFEKDGGGVKQWPVINGSPIDTSIWNLGCYSASPLQRMIGRRGGVRGGGMQEDGMREGDRLLVLVLNSNVFTARYGRMAGRDRQTADANTELQWLGHQLRAAAVHHRQVLIAMHVPPGKDGYLAASPGREVCSGNFKDLWDPSIRIQPAMEEQTRSAQNSFLDLIDTYRHSIVGIVSSHTHMDGIRLLRNRTDDSLTALLISVPGIAPGHGNNPGFKIVQYDPVNFQLKDFITFYEDFFSDRKVKTWGDRSFSFGDVFPSGVGDAGRGGAGDVGTGGAATAGSMFDRIRTIPVDSIRHWVNSIYTVYNKDGYAKGNCVDTTIYIHYQKN